MSARRVSFRHERELLLTEIERRCKACDARVRPALTKEEARAYSGFECDRCELWNEDELTERDVPEWWEELRVTGLDTLRPRVTREGAGESELVTRLSDAWRREAGDGRGDGPDGAVAGEDSR